MCLTGSSLQMGTQKIPAWLDLIQAIFKGKCFCNDNYFSLLLVRQYDQYTMHTLYFCRGMRKEMVQYFLKYELKLLDWACVGTNHN